MYAPTNPTSWGDFQQNWTWTRYCATSCSLDWQMKLSSQQDYARNKLSSLSETLPHEVSLRDGAPSLSIAYHPKYLLLWVLISTNQLLYAMKLKSQLLSLYSFQSFCVKTNFLILEMNKTLLYDPKHPKTRLGTYASQKKSTLRILTRPCF